MAAQEMEVMMVAMAAEAPVAVEEEAVPAAAGGLNATVPALYVGDLHESVREEHLLEVFGKIGTLTSVRVCRDNATSNSLRYGYVNYLSQADAAIALEKLNHSLILDKPIRVMWSNRDPDARRSGVGNVFVKNLNDLVDNVSLQELFCKFGDILSCKVAKNEDGTSRGYGFVQFALQESADASIQNLNNSHFCGRQLHVATFIKKSERSTNNDDKYTNLYMKNLDDDITEELIKLKFSQYGLVISVKIMKRDDGTSKGFGFVSFQNPESAKRAKESMNGMLLGSKTLYVARAQKKAERKQYLQRLHEEKRNEIITKSNGSNVYIKNINDEVGDDALREWFNEFGNITSAKIMRDEKGISKGFGFVCYNTPEEAKCAMPNTPRQYRHNRGRMNGNMMHFHHTVNYVPHAQPAKEFMSMSRQRFSHAKYIPNDVMANGLAIHHGDSISSMNDAFNNLLATAPPKEQKNMLGNRLYPLVERHHPDLASKITGMLLELGNSEVVMLLYSSNMLSAKIEECVKLLQAVKPKPEDQEALHPGFLLDSAGVNAN
uniref:Polyadenylate-binding protein n=1 Tax=Oryza meridionalis TaxID=40149 RepID=A0A0E0CYS7_9ORYZ